jgi:hypothetical protein
MDLLDLLDLLERLREVRCDRQPFTPEHANCVCRLTSAAADEIERLQAELQHVRTIFRVNMLRLTPETSHAEIDRVLKWEG